jgi:hypothetical protein
MLHLFTLRIEFQYKRSLIWLFWWRVTNFNRCHWWLEFNIDDSFNLTRNGPKCPLCIIALLHRFNTKSSNCSSNLQLMFCKTFTNSNSLYLQLFSLIKSLTNLSFGCGETRSGFSIVTSVNCNTNQFPEWFRLQPCANFKPIYQSHETDYGCRSTTTQIVCFLHVRSITTHKFWNRRNRKKQQISNTNSR